MKSKHARCTVKILSLLAIVIGLSLSPHSTDDSASGVSANQAAPTLDKLRETIFIPTCGTTSCHSSLRAVGLLVLDGFNAYANLVDVPAEIPAAKAAGKRRVVPGKPDESFLFQKITGRLNKDEGDRMPQNLGLLPPEQIEMIRQWILHGALPSSTKDITMPEPYEGAQVVVPPFPVPAGTEIQGQYYTTLPNTEEMRITRFEVLSPPGSHHLDFFAYQGGGSCPPEIGNVGPLPDGTFRQTFEAVPFCAWALRAFNQRIHQIWDLPPGVAFRFKSRQPVIARPHFVNTGPQTSPIGGMAVINLHAAFDPAEAPITMGTLFSPNFRVVLPPGSLSRPSTTIWDLGVTFDLFGVDSSRPPGSGDPNNNIPPNPPLITRDVVIAALNGHFHWRGKSFEIRLWDGKNKVQSGPTRGAPIGCAPCLPGQDTSWTEFDRMGEKNQLYLSENWNDPPFKVYEAGQIIAKPSQGIVYRVTFVNNTNMTIRFGPHAETEEHANVFVYFYPGPSDGRTLVFPLPFQN